MAKCYTKSKPTNKLNVWAADFETTTDKEDCRVWAWGACNVYTEEFIYGNTIDGFLDWCTKSNNPTLYFHNLKFDADFVIDKIMRSGYEFVEDKRDLASKTFAALISDMNVFYNVEIIFKKQGHRVSKVKLLDSVKLIHSNIKQMAKDFGLPFEKGELDYHTFRPIGHIITPEELDYLRRDCLILAHVLRDLFKYGVTKTTIGASALHEYKQIIGKKTFEKWYPVLDCHTDIKKAYRGGYTYCSERYKGKTVGRFNVYDVNSLYPSVMYYKPLPWGYPEFFTGKYTGDKKLYIQQIRCQFELKPGYLPTIQIKHDERFLGTEYLKTSECKDRKGRIIDDEVILYLTNVDLDIFLRHYNVYNIDYINGYAFNSSTRLFTDYIDKWSKNKIDAKESKNKSLYTISKHFLTNLYGKFGTSEKAQNRIPYFCEEENRVKYRLSEEKTKNTIYMPVAVFVTSWARSITINAAQENYANFMYADTDSLHLEGRTPPVGLDIHPTRLGAWDWELEGYKAKFLGQKAYLEYGRKPGTHKVFKKVTVSGLKEDCHQYVTLNNFEIGATYPGQKKAKRVAGGTIIQETTHTLRERAVDKIT